MAMTGGGGDDGAPMGEMNTTPLIDVLLVLLIMFIISIPVATHAVNIDLPQPNPIEDDIQVDPVQNKLVLTQEEQILWNGDPVNQGQLVTLLQRTAAMTPEPELQFEPEALASYDLSARVLNIIKGAGVTNFGFVGNEQYRTFGAAGG